MTVADFQKRLSEYPGEWEVVIEYTPDEQYNIMVLDLIDHKSYEYNKSQQGNYAVSDQVLKRLYITVRSQERKLLKQ